MIFIMQIGIKKLA